MHKDLYNTLQEREQPHKKHNRAPLRQKQLIIQAKTKTTNNSS